MDSQETANNAAETPSDRGINTVKSNAPLPSGIRARPQGPPGIPRHPINNGPIGQPRLGQPQQIRFDNRPPVGQSNSGQFIQLRALGSPRPAGGSFSQRPPQQGQNPPIVLNPRFALSPGQRIGPQPGPRQPHPGNHQTPQSLGSSQRPQTPNQNTLQQQARKPEVLARSPEITQKQLQRNETSLNISQQDLPSRKEDKRPTPPRIVINKMADVDNSKKLQQCENITSMQKVELRENTDNDDDDDVVTDGKSPRADSDATSQKEGKYGVQTVKRPETATINGTIGNKAEGNVQRTVGKIDNTATNLKCKQPVPDSDVMETDSRLCSTRANENAHKQEMDKTDSKLEESIEKQAQQVSTGKENSNEESIIKSESHAVFSKSDNSNVEQSSNKLEVGNTEQIKGQLNGPPMPPEISRTTTPTKQNEDKTQQVKTTEPQDKSADKSRAGALTKPNQEPNRQEPNTPSKSSDSSRVSGPIEVKQGQNEQRPEVLKSPKQSLDGTKDITHKTQDESTRKLNASSMSPSEPRAGSPAEITQDKKEQESNALSKYSDNSRVIASAEINQRQSNKCSEVLSKSPNISHDTVSTEIEKNKNEDELKVDTRQPNTLQASTPAERNQYRKEPEKSDDKIESKTALILETKSATESSKSAEKPKAEVPPSSGDSLNQRGLTDESSKSSDVSTNVAKGFDTSDVLENRHPDQLVQESLHQNVASSTTSPGSERDASKTQKSSILLEDQENVGCLLSPHKSPEEGVKGFDNGEQRSLSIKSSPSKSPRSTVSPKSPKSPSGNEKKMPESKAVSKFAALEVQHATSPATLAVKSDKKFSTAPEIENGSVTNEPVQPNAQPTTNGVAKSPTKGKESDKRSTAGSPVKSPSKSVKSLPRTPDTPSSTGGQEKKKLPMNKIQVGSAPSPNLKTVRSKIGSLDNASYKPGGGKVKIENRKLDFSKAQPKIAAKNEKYTPSGGDKKISQVKLQWNAKSKIGSLENATYKPGGGDKKIETVKLDFKDKAKPKVGSKENAKHVPGGGSVKSSAAPSKMPLDTNNDIQTQKIDIKAESKIGSLDNVKHKPGGGDKKIFNDTEYLRHTGSNVESLSGSGSQSPVPPGTVTAGKNGLPTSDENLNQES